MRKPRSMAGLWYFYGVTFALAMILKPFAVLAICLPVRYLAIRYLPQGRAREFLLRPLHRESGSRSEGLQRIRPAKH